MMKNQKRAVCLLACLLIAGFTAAQEKKNLLKQLPDQRKKAIVMLC